MNTATEISNMVATEAAETPQEKYAICEDHPRFRTLKVTSDADIQLVRDLCENKLKRDLSRKPLSRIRVDAKRTPIRLVRYNDFAKRDDYKGQKFIHFTSGSEVEVMNRNAYGKLIIRWHDGNMNAISQREFEATFSRK